MLLLMLCILSLSRLSLGSAAPSRVTDLRHDMINASTIRVLWGEPSTHEDAVAGYYVFIRDVQEAEEVSHKLDATKFSYDFSSSKEYALFQFTVAAYALDPRDQSKPIIGGNETITARTWGKYPPPPMKIRSEILSCHEVGLSWKPSDFESDVNSSIYRIQCSTQMQACFETAFSKDDSIELRDLQASSSYTVDISACIDEERCGSAAAHSFSTPPGNPSIPRSLKALRSEHSMLISWEPPEHFEGFLDGYVLGFCLSNEEDCPLNDEWEHVERSKTSVTRPGHDVVSKVVLKAFNKDGAKSLYSDAAFADVENEKKTSGPPILFILACLVMTGVVFFGVYLQYRRKRSDGRHQTLLVTANLSAENAEIRMS